MHPVNRLPNSSRVYYATAVEVMAEKKKEKNKTQYKTLQIPICPNAHVNKQKWKKKTLCTVHT